MLDRYYRRKAEAIEVLGGKCVRCGSVEDLEFDHIDPSTKISTIGKLASTASEEKLWTEVAKCQLLCKACHKEKSKQEDGQRRPITHGKYHAAYRYKCHCIECDEYRKNRNR